MKKLLGCLLALILLLPVSVLAIPTLGVAPGIPGSSGTYLGSSSGAAYLEVFANDFLNLPGGDGFLVPSTGSFEITIWYGSNNIGGVPFDVPIYLCTDAADGLGFSFTTGGAFQANTVIAAVDIEASTYKDPTFGVNIGDAGGWSQLVLGEFAGKDFRFLTGTINVGNSLEPGEWLYAVADIDGNEVIGGGEFSPPTTSSTAPEPATMLLLGSGLIGLAGFGRKKFKK